MKANELSKKEALNYVFKNSPVISIRFDKRKSIVRQILSMYTIEELNEIERKKMNRIHNYTVEYAPIVRYRKLISSQNNANNYRKNLIIGIKSIYFTSPVYLHRDYNKSVFFENTENNRIKAILINRLINKAI